MSKPNGESLHPRKAGLGGQGNLPAFTPALMLAGILLLIACFLYPSPTFGAQLPRLIPPTTAEGERSLPSDTEGPVETAMPSPTGRWIVAGRPGRETHARAIRLGAEPISQPLGIYALDEDLASGLVDSLRRIGAYRFSEPDTPTLEENGSSETEPTENVVDQWWLDEITQPGRIPKVTDKSPVMALLEQSLDPKHPDLAGLDARGRLLEPFSFEDTRDARGTAMAALAASLALDTDGRISGVWPGMRVRLGKSDDTCEAKTKAVYRAARTGRNRVIAMGYSFPAGSCFSHYLATEYAVYRNIVPVAAAGEPGRSASTASPPRPAGDPHVLTVTSSDPKRSVPVEAGRGPWIDLTAPGYGLTVPWLGSDGQGPIRKWSPQSGTAYSTAITAAAATWLLQARPTLNARQVIRLLTDNTTPLASSGHNQTSGNGLLNLTRALRAGTPTNDPFEPNDDIDWVRANSLITDGSGGKKVGRKLFWSSGRKPKKVTATLGRTEDPTDVYRIQMAPRSKAVIAVSQFIGRTELRVFGPRSRSISEGQLIGKSDRPPGAKADAVEIRNRGRQAQAVFIAVGVSAKKGSRRNATYKLSVESRR